MSDSSSCPLLTGATTRSSEDPHTMILSNSICTHLFTTNFTDLFTQVYLIDWLLTFVGLGHNHSGTRLIKAFPKLKGKSHARIKPCILYLIMKLNSWVPGVLMTPRQRITSLSCSSFSLQLNTWFTGRIWSRTKGVLALQVCEH